MQEKNCEYCGGVFKTSLDFKIYCSVPCSSKGPMSKRRYGGNHYYVLKRDEFKCRNCGDSEQLHVHHKDENLDNNDMSNLITLCQSCHKHIHHHGERNNHYRHITKEQVMNAIEITDTLDEASELLGITRKTLMHKREVFGLPQLSNGRSGSDNKLYIELTLNEVEMAYELEGTWKKAAVRLGVSESFLRKRYKELKGLDKVVNRIYKDISKEEVLNAFNEGGTWKKAAEILGISKKTMTSKREKYGLK